MNILKIVFKELLGMFIDDGALALLSLILIAAVGLVVKLGFVTALVGALILAVGCLLILAESVFRAAKAKVRSARQKAQAV
ncbi:hypothetical protein HGP14_32470 [Rhizobium sp. P32RR-XVIII]|uniref:hypothetical protein n=1 Tax=Rhizobium sp. P32RR-XVIII TaxID=2726738 RepID=UPI001456C77D|nr:hypothetical protein [Rhizobium sp. P32RR-XVIII]NLS07943.1 hypothetical protein [Rhizobium sp. P32RR-XVIII]